MKYSYIPFLITICFSQALLAHSPNWHLDGANEGWKEETLALKYFHHSELQRQWAWHLLGATSLQGDEQILDFGCGDGKITAELSHFIPSGEIKGVDLSPSMIELARRCFPKTNYPNVDFSKTTNVDFAGENLQGKFDLICSFCVFHVVPNPIPLLRNLRNYLKDDGKLLLVIPSGNNPALFQAANELFPKYKLTPPWAGKGKGSNTPTMRTFDGCTECLNEAGFKIVSIQPLHTPTAFYNKQDLVEWMFGTLTANWQLPLDKAEDFFNDLVDRMSEIDRELIDPSGAYNFKLSRFEVVATVAK